MLSGPKNFKQIRENYPEKILLLEEWLSNQLDLLQLRYPDLEVGVTLYAGLDTLVTKLCIHKGIPYVAIAASAEQSLGWTEELQKDFFYFQERAKEIIFATPGRSVPGCVRLQFDTLSKWTLSVPERKLFLIKDGSYAVFQQKRKEAFQKEEITIYVMSRFKSRIKLNNLKRVRSKNVKS